MRRASGWVAGIVAVAAASAGPGAGCGNGGLAAPAGGSGSGGSNKGTASQGTPPGTGSASTGGNAMTGSTDTQDRVQRAAGAGAAVIPLREVSLPKLELFWLSTRIPSDKDSGRGIAVVDGKLPWLEGAKAMEVVFARTKDAAILARAAIVLLLSRGTLLVKPDDSPSPLTPAQRAVITPPVLTATALEFWYFAGRPGTFKVHVDLATWHVRKTPLQAQVQAGQDPVELARQQLADPGLAVNQGGIDKLATLCAEPRAMAVLVDALATNPRAPTRARAAAALAKCKPAGAVPALSAALRKDAEVAVRKAAVEALGTLADPAARPALEHAAKADADTDVRSYAQWALGKLKP